MTIKNITKKIFYKTFSGILINIILNYIFINKYGVIGAALATAVTHFLSLFIFDFFIEEYKEQAIVQLKSLNPFYIKRILVKSKRGK